MAEFQEKNKSQLKRLPLEQIELYYRELRKYQYDTNAQVYDIEKKKRNYKLVRYILNIDKILSRRTINIINNNKVDNGRPRIYACTHIGRYDIESVIEAIGENTWFLMGDPGKMYLNLGGKILSFNGVIYFDTEDKMDRHIALETCIKILNAGGNILIFPEGAWNLDTIYPVQQLFPGVIEMAIRGKADIIPVGIEQYRKNKIKDYWINIGKNINITNESLDNKKQLTDMLRWKLTDLKWEIWEKYGYQQRKSIPNDWFNAKQDFINFIMSDTENGYTIEEIEKTSFHEKEKNENYNEVFFFFNNINLNYNNAFLAKSIYKYKQNNNKILKKTL